MSSARIGSSTPQQLLDREAVDRLVEDRGQVVGAGQEGDGLGPGAELDVLLDARVQVADDGYAGQ